MCPFQRLLIRAALVLVPMSSATAQIAADPSGHWQGAIQAPEMTVEIEIDLAKNSKGSMAGTFTQPGQAVKGLPLSDVVVEGRTIRFELRPGEGGGSFRATLSADGATLSGDYVTKEGGYTLPFTLTRTGEAKIAPAPKSASIGKEIEGAWKGALDLGTRQMHVVLTMANQGDGTARGTIASPNGSGVEIPVGMTHKGTSLRVDVPSVGASFVGTVNAAATEIVGTWTQGPTSLPLTLRR